MLISILFVISAALPLLMVISRNKASGILLLAFGRSKRNLDESHTGRDTNPIPLMNEGEEVKD